MINIQNFNLYPVLKLNTVTALVVAVVLAVICSHIWYGAYTEQTLRFADSGYAMLTAADGFFYLAQAENYLTHGGNAPALARLAALIKNITGFELTNIAFWIPVFLTFLLCFVYSAWAVLLKFSPFITALAVLVGMFVPAWIERSRMGWFDTDTGIALLWHACLVSTAFLAMPERRFSLPAFACMLISGGLLAWWWKPGMLLLPACFAMWGFAFLWAKNKNEKCLRLIIFAIVIFIALLIFAMTLGLGLFFLPEIWNAQLTGLRTYAIEHLRLVTGITGNIISTSIQEIANMPIKHSLTIIGGSSLGGTFAVLSLGLFCIFKRHIAFFLLPALCMWGFGFLSERFIYFGAVPIGLAVAWLTGQVWKLATLDTIEISNKLSAKPETTTHVTLSITPATEIQGTLLTKPATEIQETLSVKPESEIQETLSANTESKIQETLSVNFWSRFFARFSIRSLIFRLIAMSIATIILYSQVYWFFNWLPEGYFVNAHDKIAVALRLEAPPNAPVWAWWDDGYFLRARTGLTPMFDGGSQNPYTAAIVARPLMTPDTRFSSRWIRFFALRGIHALNPLIAAWGEHDKTWALVEKIFSADKPEIILATLPPIKVASGNATDWLFPKGQVFIYFSQRILRLSKWWGSIGLHAYPKQEQLKTYINVFERGMFLYNPATKYLRLPDEALEKGYAAVSEVFLTSQKPIVAPFPQNDGLFVVASPYSRWLYITNLLGLISLPLRLMAPAGAELHGFRLVSADYDYAGAWEVLP